MEPVRSFEYRRTLREIADDVWDAARRVLSSGRLMFGAETTAFEEELATSCGTEHAVGVASGAAALQVALAALGVGPGDEVVTVANTCPPTAAAIRMCGAEPVFVDVCDDDLQMDIARVADALSERTRCIVPVHLWGHAVDVPALLSVAGDIPVIEDCAQAQGTLLRGRHVGTFGAAGCLSFYPTKNLGAYGDAGAVITRDGALAERMRRVRTYGLDEHGVAVESGGNFRIDELHAAILRVKLRHLHTWIARRRAIAREYSAGITAQDLRLPPEVTDVEPSFHQYVVRCAKRDAVRHRLDAADVQSQIHYAIPLHRMPAFAQRAQTGALPVTEQAAAEILSLPVHEALRDDEVQRVIDALNG